MNLQHGTDTVPAQEWRKFHKITPLAKLGGFWVALAVLVFSFVKNALETVKNWNAIVEFAYLSGVSLTVIFILGALLFISLAIVFIAWLMWRKMSYAIVDSGIHFRQGIFFIHHNQMRWDRVQTVDIEQKVFGRIFGFASVQISSAGNTKDLTLGLLKLADCAQLRKEILQILNLVRSGVSAAQALKTVRETPFSGMEAAETAQNVPSISMPPIMGATLEATETAADKSAAAKPTAAGNSPMPAYRAQMQFIAPGEIPVTDVDQQENDQQIFALPTGRLIGATLLDSRMGWILLSAGGVLVGTIIAGESTIGIILLGITLLWNATKSLFKEYGTKIYLSENGLRRRAGLTTVKTRTYPPQRIHALELRQSFFWRKFGWWEVSALVAGNAVASDINELAGTVALAAKKEEALRLLWTILPRLGAADDSQLLTEALHGLDSGKYFQGAPRRARLFDPISFRGRGVYAAKEVLIVREGRFNRRVIFVFQDHTQSLRLARGPLQKRRKLATLHVHLVLGGLQAKVKNFDQEVLSQLAQRELELTKMARSEGISETLQQWKERLGLAAQLQPTAPSPQQRPAHLPAVQACSTQPDLAHPQYSAKPHPADPEMVRDIHEKTPKYPETSSSANPEAGK